MERAEDAGLLRLSSTCVEFRHPLVRAAVHGAASPSERRKAHGWLAAAYADAGDRDRAAWHLATAAFGPDEDAAQALEDVAHATLQRGACSVAARAFERAAELTGDRGVRDERLADAAAAYWAAGAAQRAVELLEDVLTRISAHARRAQLLALRGNIEHRTGDSVRAMRLLLDAADLIAVVDKRASVPMLADAFEAALQSGSLITARLAAEQGKDVFAIPGSIHSPFAKGCHKLIRDGAKLVETANDVLDELSPQRGGAQGASIASRDAAHADAHPVLAAMGYDPVSVDALVARMQAAPESIAAELVRLELAGEIAPLPGGYWQRLHRGPPTH